MRARSVQTERQCSGRTKAIQGLWGQRGHGGGKERQMSRWRLERQKERERGRERERLWPYIRFRLYYPRCRRQRPFLNDNAWLPRKDRMKGGRGEGEV